MTVSQILKAPWGRVLYAMRWVCAPSLSGLWACPTVRVPCSRRAHGGRGWELPIRTCTNSEALIQAVHNGLGRLGLGIPRLSGVTSALAPPISLLSASNSTHFGAVPRAVREIHVVVLLYPASLTNTILTMSRTYRELTKKICCMMWTGLVHSLV